MMTDTPEVVTLVPIDRIEVLNSRDRNMKVFEEIVENIRAIGLKKPITVTEREGADGTPAYLLVCGEGRLNAFRLLGETHIPALVVNVSDEDAFIMSLAENIARRGHRPLEILADIELLLARHYTIEDIIIRTGLSEKYVRDIVFLLEKGEERLPDAVLVAHKDRAQEVKQAVAALKAKAAPQAETLPRDYRPWGWYESLVVGPRFQVKRIVVHPGAALSLQSHHHRAEHWIVVEGTAKVTVDTEVKLVTENQSVYIPLGAVHRMENPGKVPLTLIEVQTGSYLGEDDIIRYEDVYARGHGAKG